MTHLVGITDHTLTTTEKETTKMLERRGGTLQLSCVPVLVLIRKHAMRHASLD